LNLGATLGGRQVQSLDYLAALGGLVQALIQVGARDGQRGDRRTASLVSRWLRDWWLRGVVSPTGPRPQDTVGLSSRECHR
jgi:hypothetical protein